MSTPEFSAIPVETVRLLPIYVLCDTSGSMEHDGAIEAVNKGLAGILNELNLQGAKGNDIRICILSFATHAAVALPLTSVEMDTAAPTLRAEGVTNLPAAIELLAQTISNDYHKLRDEGARAYRPAVFVFTDGRPTDGRGHELTDHSAWLDRLEELKLHPVWAPRVYAYGFGAAQPVQLKRMVNEKGVSDHAIAGRVKFSGAEAADSIARIFPHLFNTITDAANAAASGASDAEVGIALDNAHASADAVQLDDPEDWWGTKITGAP